ncbi:MULTISPECIES: HAD family phosphatase [Terrabacteria group]|uniref:HAD family hydrolase n=1 Tax=Bacillati TaxID=1783272 RepID=UPI00193A94FA|nr:MULTISPECIES: HAD family phosphatase [Terrabacteria group]MBW9211976.1 HAD family phosphatase [Trueperella sp. zg.1013]QRG87219.1 HAD family phosphatase [Bulleidia sp. zg-1006]
MKYNAVIFDFNGTLLFDTDLHVKAWDTISQSLNCGPITLETILTKYWGLANIDLLKGLTGNRYSDEEYTNLSKKKEALYRSYVEADSSFQLVDGVPELLDYLKDKNIPFTIASASIKDNIDFYIRHFHLDQWMDPKSIIYDDGSYANKKEMYQQAMKNLKVSDKVLVFEDSIHGIKAALEIGADVIAIDSPQLRNLHHPNIKACIHNYQNIFALFD